MAAENDDTVDRIINRMTTLLDAREQRTCAKIDVLAAMIKEQHETMKIAIERGGRVPPGVNIAPRGSSRNSSMEVRENLGTKLSAEFRDNRGARMTMEARDNWSITLGKRLQEKSQTSLVHGKEEQEVIQQMRTESNQMRADVHWDVVMSDVGLPQIVIRHDKHKVLNCFWRPYLRRLVEWPKFDFFWLTVICVNALFMGVQLQLYAKNGEHHWTNAPGEITFTFLFLIELVLRATGLGCRWYLCGPDWMWAVIDISIVSISLIDVAVNHIFSAGPADSPSSSSSFRVLRLLRVLRVAKVIRGIRFLRNLRLLIVGMINSVLAIAWTVITLFFFMYIGTVIIMSIACDRIIAGEEYYVENWGGVVESMFTLFQVMTGDSWWSGVVKGMAKDYPGIEFLFIAYFSFTAYGLLNIVTGIFVEQTLTASHNDAELLKDQTDASRHGTARFLDDIFYIMDANQDGHVNYIEFETFLTQSQVRFAFEQIGLKADDVRNLFVLLDKGGDGTIDKKEFIEGCMKIRGGSTTGDIIETGLRITRQLNKAVARNMEVVGPMDAVTV